MLGGQRIAAMEGEPPAERSYNHVAFKISDEDQLGFQAAIEELGLDIKRKRVPAVDFTIVTSSVMLRR